MNKVWEFAVTPKDAAVIAGCLVLAGVLLSGTGFVTGLIVAPRYMAFQAKAAVTMAQSAKSAPPQPAEAPVKPKLAIPAEPAVLAAKNETPASTAQAPFATGIESAVVAVSPAAMQAAPAGAAMPPAAPAPMAAPAPIAAPAPVAAAVPKPAPLPIRLAVQVGSFSIEKNARNIVERLTRLGYPAAAFPTTDAQNRRWSVVQVGPYAAYESASRTVLELSRNYRLQPVIIPLTIPLAGF